VLLNELAAMDAVDDFCLTLSPRLVGGDERRWPPSAAPIPDVRDLTVESVIIDAGFLFAKYRVK
jgi:hypothetical protein